MPRSPPSPTLTAVKGVRVGHATEPSVPTGVTALLFEGAAPTVVDVRGGASGVYDTASLALDATFGGRHALFLSGGSIYGLDAARGIRVRILETGGGVFAFGHPVPIVPISGAVLFDLPRPPGFPIDYLPLGYEAARAASRDPVPTGRVGAGAGATLGKYLGRGRAVPGGLGSRASRLPHGHTVGVLVVVNAVGAVHDPATGRWLAGPRDAAGRVIPPESGSLRRGRTVPRGTTLACVVTDAPFERRELQRLAVAAHDGLARTIVPVHTATDGDVVFVTTTAPRKRTLAERYPGARVDEAGLAVTKLVIGAVADAVRAEPTPRRASTAGGARPHAIRG